MYQRLRSLIRGERFWMVLASLALRGQAFLVGLLITRLYGPEGLGLYAATLNVAASLVTPLTSLVQNNAAWLSARSSTAAARRRLIEIHLPWLLAGGLLSLAGVLGLAQASGLPLPWLPGGGWVLLAAASVIFYQLFNALGQGLLQGVGRFLGPAQASVALTLILTVMSWPAIVYGGVHGAYLILAIGSIALPCIALAIYLIGSERVDDRGVSGRPSETVLSVSLLLQRWRVSWPSVVAALISSAVTWLCLVYLVHRSHGSVGVGWVSLGVQWGTLMLLPVTSWGGLTMKRILDSVSDRSGVGLRAVVARLVIQNGGVTLGLAALVVLASGALGWLYRLPAGDLAAILMLTAVYAVLGSLNNVLERLYFCVHEQRAWMWLTSLGAVAQVLVTAMLIEHSYLAVAGGLAAGALSTLLAAWLWFWRSPRGATPA